MNLEKKLVYEIYKIIIKNLVFQEKREKNIGRIKKIN